MKRTIFILSLVFTVVTGALAAIEYIYPTEKMVDVAIQILKEAKQAREDGNIELYKAKIKKAKYFLRVREKEINFKGKIHYMGRDFREPEIFFDTDIRDACWDGNQADAIKLLNSGDFDWDEVWLKNARKGSGTKIAFDIVDGKGESSAKTEIPQCSDVGTEVMLIRIGELAEVHNGGIDVFKYNVKTFNYKKHLTKIKKDLKKSNSEGGCQVEIKSGKKSVLAALDDLDYGRSTDMLGKYLQPLIDSGLIKYFIFDGWVGESNDSESCSTYNFNFYTKDGYVLWIGFSFTT